MRASDSATANLPTQSEPIVRPSANGNPLDLDREVFLSFAEFSLSPELARSIKDRGHHEATPIQTGAIPVAMTGRDLIATAETGSGKTAAYLIPLIDKLHGKRSGGKPVAGICALVLVPTREAVAKLNAARLAAASAASA